MTKTQPERLSAFYEGWKNASEELPEDLEASMFHVLTMLATAPPNDKSYKVQLEAGNICEKVLERIPDHPGAIHYALHAYDFPPLAPKALLLARNYYKIAPEIPHALHMPTHIFTRLGYWQESINLNIRSAAVAIKIPVNGYISAQYLHALDYLTYAYIQQSQFEKAKDIATLIDTLNGKFQTSPISAYALASIHARLVLEYQNWAGASTLSLSNFSDFPWTQFPQYEALIYFTKGIGAGRSGNAEIVLKAYKRLEELQNTFKDTEANKYWINQIEIQKNVIKAWQLFVHNEKDKSLETMKAAADLEDASEKNPVTPGALLPAREILGDLLLELNKPKEALHQYELSLINSPNRFNSLYGAGKSAELIGDKDKAKFYFTALININKYADLNREQLAYALSVVN